MFEAVLERKALDAIQRLAPFVSHFYLAGGTALALQIGHRRSLDFDFFSTESFEPETLLTCLPECRILSSQRGTLHVEMDPLKLSFLYYPAPLLLPLISWKGIRMADWRDIVAEKFKSLSQRGCKKDFYDLYAVVRSHLSIEEACKVFRDRFAHTNINVYHVLKSLLFFEDAEKDPDPYLLEEAQEWEWEEVKRFFRAHIQRFDKALLGT